MQVYNFTVDKKTGKPSATAECHVINAVTRQPVYDHETDNLTPDLNGITIKEVLSQGTLEPGSYEVAVTVYDLVSKQALTPTAKFVVK